ncbi:MAG: CYTH domain-containing protein [Patescibacteria group bacterium]|nr:CYTH domain-containing protein [Patescibacteria group bacterium]MDE1940907.1 CYTH domain-containing protein [Patescibacteria group bacterium]MDE1966910.1 CYTH domain-containing protein [Patescibacteria group bacterium]
MIELELEKTYLARRLPEGLEKCQHREVFDTYYPPSAAHPVLRLRKNGDRYEMTKKEPDQSGDASIQTEHTIRLTKEEFDSLAKTAGKKVRKIRYDYPYKEANAEVAVFQDGLKGLVLVDVEFKSVRDMKAFGMPDFCLADVTDDETFAGGMLCGKSYQDISDHLNELGYQPPK